MSAKWAVVVKNSTQIKIAETTIRNVFNGIICDFSSPKIINDTFEEIVGTAIQVNASSPKISGVIIDRADDGIAATNSSFIIENCVIKNASRGVYLGGVGSSFVTANRITKSGTGIAVSSDTRPKLRRNIITHNSFGVAVDWAAFPDLGSTDDLGFNQVHSNVEKDAFDNRENKAVAISAMGNWWGQVKPDTNKFEGNINYGNWLKSAPSQFGDNITFSKHENLTVGERFSVSIALESFIPIAGWEFDLKFNPNVLEIISISEGNFFAKTVARRFFFQEGVIDNKLGDGGAKGFGKIL